MCERKTTSKINKLINAIVDDALESGSLLHGVVSSCEPIDRVWKRVAIGKELLKGTIGVKK